MGKQGRCKRKSPDAASDSRAVTARRSIGSTPSNGSTFEVGGALLVKAFEHVRRSVAELQNLWISAEDWCKILPIYYSSLRDYKEQITTKKFNRAMNKRFGDTTMIKYYEKNDDGVYSNKYGRGNPLYYLFTN